MKPRKTRLEEMAYFGTPLATARLKAYEEIESMKQMLARTERSAKEKSELKEAIRYSLKCRGLSLSSKVEAMHLIYKGAGAMTIASLCGQREAEYGRITQSEYESLAAHKERVRWVKAQS